MEKTKNKKAFTLVELIIVITILSILATIAFISFQWYNSNARDWVRVSDISSIKTSLDLFYLKSGSYPIPSEPLKTVTYSGVIAFYEGMFGESVLRQVQLLNKEPKDPFYKDINYTYSITNKKNQYQIWYVTENLMANILPIIDTALASTMISQVDWNYSWSILISTGGTNLIYSSPTIITSYSSSGTFDVASLFGTFVTDWWTENIPFSYLEPLPPPPTPPAPIDITFTDTDGIIVTCTDCIVYP